MDRYAIIYADPPWDYKGQTQHAGAGSKATGSAQTHYNTLTLPQLKRLNLRDVCAENALLFMWVTGPFINQGVDLMTAWGFAFATVAFVWDKQAVNPGFYTMSQTEFVFVGKRGSIPRPRGARNMRQLVSEKRTEHSVKPEEVRYRIEAMFPTQRKLEIFARRPAPGWDVWGNEVETNVPLRFPPE